MDRTDPAYWTIDRINQERELQSRVTVSECLEIIQYMLTVLEDTVVIEKTVAKNRARDILKRAEG